MVEERHLNNAELAQLGERLPYKQNVGGSSPSFRTKIYKLVPILKTESVCATGTPQVYISTIRVGGRVGERHRSVKPVSVE